MDVTFNFMGMCVADWRRAHHFFTQILGLDAELNPAHGDWANLGAAWAGYYSDTHSLVCELFDGETPPARHAPNVCPAIHVADLDAQMAHLSARGVRFVGGVERAAWGSFARFETVEGIQWALAQVPGAPVRPEFRQPQIGHIVLRTADFDAQKDFYGRKIGFTARTAGESHTLLTQSRPQHPFIVLERGGAPVPAAPADAPHPERGQGFFLSFMTPDIHAVARACDAHDITRLRPITRHDDWGGTDMMIADADGNVIQVVQYHEPSAST